MNVQGQGVHSGEFLMSFARPEIDNKQQAQCNVDPEPPLKLGRGPKLRPLMRLCVVVEEKDR